MNEAIRALVDANGGLAWRGEPQSDESINRAEKDLGVVFPEAFREYLREFGWLSFGPNEYMGLGCTTQSVVSATRNARERSKLPLSFIVLADHDGDEFVCLDCSGTSSAGQVVIWDVPTCTVSRVRGDDLADFLMTDMLGFLEES